MKLDWTLVSVPSRHRFTRALIEVDHPSTSVYSGAFQLTRGATARSSEP